MRRGLAMLGTFTLVLAGCATTSAGTADGRRIEIEMKEFTFTSSPVVLRPGEKVTLSLKNIGVVEHEFMAGRTGVPGKGYSEDLLAGIKYDVAPGGAAHGSGHGGSGVLVGAKRSATLTFVVPDRPGTFEFGCFLPGHYESGMKGVLTIG